VLVWRQDADARELRDICKLLEMDNSTSSTCTATFSTLLNGVTGGMSHCPWPMMQVMG
jgi:hypothetical protein